MSAITAATDEHPVRAQRVQLEVTGMSCVMLRQPGRIDAQQASGRSGVREFRHPSGHVSSTPARTRRPPRCARRFTGRVIRPSCADPAVRAIAIPTLIARDIF